MEARTDDFHSPKPKKSAERSVVNAVLAKVSSLGTSLLSLLSGLLAAALILYSGYVLYDSFRTQENAKSGWDLLQYKPAILEMGENDVPTSVQNRLAAINDDYRAWLTVYDTNIDYPVMQGPDDYYYAYHDVYKANSLTGAIYLAAGNSRDLADSYNVIYGHHMDNKAMFGGLDEFIRMEKVNGRWEIVGGNEAYFNSHREGVLVSQSAVYDLKAFAVATTDAYQNSVYAVGDRMSDVVKFLQENRGEEAPEGSDTWTMIFDEETLNGADKVVALSTCADATTNGRLVVFYTATQRNLITVNAEGNTWVYDGLPHTLKDQSDDGSKVYYTTNYPGDDEHPTTVEYSIDGGKTWTTDPPQVTNVSESTDVIVRITNDAYGRSTITVRLEVEPKPVTVKADADQQKVYGQGDPAFTATVEGLVGNDSIEYTVTRPGAGTDEDADTYANAIVASGAAEQGNYVVTYENADFTITPAPMKLDVTGFDGPYDGQEHPVQATASVTKDTVIEYSTDGGKTWTTEVPSIKDVDEKTVMVRATNPNYETDPVTVTLKVEPKPVTVKADPVKKLYGSAEPAYTATVTGLVGDDTVEYTVTRPGAGQNEDVGVHKDAIVASGAARQGNYAVTYENADFTVLPSTLDLRVQGFDGTYDGQDHPVTVTGKLPEGTVVEYSTDGGKTWTTEVPSIRNAGEQTVQVRATNPNFEPETVTVTLKVDPKAVTVKADPVSKPANGAEPVYTATVTGLVGDDTIEYTVTRPGAGKDEAVGVYKDAIVASGETEQGNYVVTYGNADFTVTADKLAVDVTGFDGVYDGQDHPVIVADDDLPEGTVVEYSTDGGKTWTTEPPSINDVDEETVTVRVSHPDYEPTEVTVTLKVEPKPVTVKADPVSKPLNGAEPKYTATVTGLMGDDKIEYTVKRPGAGKDEKVGVYKDAIVASGAARQGNYAITYENADFTVTAPDQLALDVTGFNGVYDGKEHPVKVTVNVPDGTTVEYSTDGGKTWTKIPPYVKDVDEKTVIIRATNPDFDPVVTTTTLRIRRAAVKVLVHDRSKIYGRPDPTFTAAEIGLLGNDTLRYTISRPDAENQQGVGIYADSIVASGAKEQGNYTVTYVPGDFEVIPSSALTLKATGFDGVYDGREHPVQVDVSALFPEDSADTLVEYSTDGGQTWTTEVPSIKDMGEKTVMIRATNPNYRTVTATVRLQITAKAVTVKANPTSKTVNGIEPEYTATVTGLVGDDTIEYTVTRPGAGRDEAVGTYPNAIVASGAAEQGNYAVTYENADFTVTAAEQLVVNVTGFDGPYDGQEHSVKVSVNVPEGTTIEYSTDGGQTWTKVPPFVKDVDEIEVTVRASNPNYEPTVVTTTLKVEPAPVRVLVSNSNKIYGQPDPDEDSYIATIIGLVGYDAIEYTVTRPGAENQVDAGIYPGAIIAEGEREQGNYIVTYVPGDFEIVPSPALTLNAEGFTGVYDGQEHPVQVDTSTLFPEDNENTLVEYSLDGGKTWTTEVPSIKDVDEKTVMVRATNPNYLPVTSSVKLKITPRQVIVSVGNYSKLTGHDDPEFTATVQGLIDGDTIEYTISRKDGDTPSSYAITVEGEAEQGNYTVVYYNGTLRVIDNPAAPVNTTTPDGTPAPGDPGGTIDIPDPEDIEDVEPPLAKVIRVFEPKGITSQKVWALVNLLALIITIYLFLPLLHLRAKFDRARMMKKINKSKRQLRLLQQMDAEEARDKNRLLQLVQEARKKHAEAGLDAFIGDVQDEEFGSAVETLFYQVKQFLRRFRLGMLLELIFAALALVLFLLTEDLTRPMVLIDKWTPAMILLMLIVWMLDVRFIRYRGKVLADEEEAARRKMEKERAALQGAAE